MTKAETVPERKIMVDTTERVNKLVEVADLNLLNETERKAGKEIIAEYVNKTHEKCKIARIQSNNFREILFFPLFSIACLFSSIPASLFLIVVTQGKYHEGLWQICLPIFTSTGKSISDFFIAILSFACVFIVYLVISIVSSPTCVCCGKMKALTDLRMCNQCLENDILAITGQRKAPDYAVKAARARLEDFIKEKMNPKKSDDNDSFLRNMW